MKKVTLLCGLLLAMTATIASAEGLNIRWNQCFGDGGAINKTFACTTNSLLSNNAHGTFVLAADMVNVSGTEVVLDIASAGSTLPAWWSFKNAGTCRQLNSGYATNLAGATCPDWAGGQATGGVGAYNVGFRGSNTARIIAASAVPVAALASLTAAQEFYAFTFQFTGAKTVGLGSCAGCLAPVCLVFNSINLTTPIAANNHKVSGPANGTDSNFCTWQGGGNPTVGNVTGCPAATPTRQATWGMVKSLYR